MIVFQKGKDGWKQSGEALPGNDKLMVLVDAQKKSVDPLFDSYDEAVSYVKEAIAKGTDRYRFEITPAPASKARKPARPAKPRKETGKQRRARLKRTGRCTACGKRKAAPRPESKGGGHYPECRTCREYYTKWAKEHRS